MLLLKLKKICEFLKTEVQFLGHTVCREGVRMCDEKTKAIHEFPVSKTH